MLEPLHLRRIGGIQNMHSREARHVAESHAKDFRTQARSPHSQQENVLEAAGLNFLGDFLKLIVLRLLLFYNVEPSQPLRFVSAGPQAGVTLPQALHLSTRLPIADGG